MSEEKRPPIIAKLVVKYSINWSDGSLSVMYPTDVSRFCGFCEHGPGPGVARLCHHVFSGESSVVKAQCHGIIHMTGERDSEQTDGCPEPATDKQSAAY